MSIHVLGTNHVSKKSVKAIEDAVKKLKPDIIAIELDGMRLEGLESKQKTKLLSIRLIKQLGIKAYLFTAIASSIQQAMGKVVGIQPGSEMLTGATLAKKNNLELALIDQPIHITMKRLNRALSIKDVVTMGVDTLKSLIQPKKFAEKYDINLAKVKGLDPEAIKQAINYMKLRFPAMYQILVHERNIYMTKQLIHLQKPGKTILAIVGAGHVAGMLELLEEPLHTYTVQGGQFNVGYSK